VLCAVTIPPAEGIVTAQSEAGDSLKMVEEKDRNM
jgi:hypothetical protein